MLENILPVKKLGLMMPLPIIDSAAYEFYCLAPAGCLLEMLGGALTEFSKDNADQHIARVDQMVDMLMERHVDLLMQSGVPPALLIGVDKHDQMIERIKSRTGKPTTSSMLNVVAASKGVGIKKMVAANRWSADMNKVLAAFFKREGIDLIGVSSEVMPAGTIQKGTFAQGVELAYQVGKRAFQQYPEADGLYIGGSGWMAQPAVERLEAEFKKPVVANQNAMVWNTMHMIEYWKPTPERGRVLGTP